MNSDGFLDRLNQITQDTSGRNFAQKAGLSSSTLRSVKKGSSPTLETLLAICRAANVRIEWLATGEGPKHPSNDDQGADAQKTSIHEGFSLIPRYAVEASAGNGRLAISETETERLAFKTEWLHEMGLSPRHCSLITAAGDSMSPTIPDGALLLVDMSPDQKIRSGCLYVIILDGDLLVKRVMRRLDGTVELISDNPIYPKEVIKASDLPEMQIPGRVVWVGHAI